MRSVEDHIANINNNLAANILNNKYISDGIYTFTTDKNVNIKMYYDATDGKRYTLDADYTKKGITYTINNIKSDIYIEIK